MKMYRVTEVVIYEVEAEDEDEACDIITESEDRDSWCVEVSDRYAVPAD